MNFTCPCGRTFHFGVSKTAPPVSDDGDEMDADTLTCGACGHESVVPVVYLSPAPHDSKAQGA